MMESCDNVINERSQVSKEKLKHVLKQVREDRDKRQMELEEAYVTFKAMQQSRDARKSVCLYIEVTAGKGLKPTAPATSIGIPVCSSYCAVSISDTQEKTLICPSTNDPDWKQSFLIPYPLEGEVSLTPLINPNPSNCNLMG